MARINEIKEAAKKNIGNVRRIQRELDEGPELGDDDLVNAFWAGVKWADADHEGEFTRLHAEAKRCRESEENAIKRMDEMGAELATTRLGRGAGTPDYCADRCVKKGPLKSGCESCPFYDEKRDPDEPSGDDS